MGAGPSRPAPIAPVATQASSTCHTDGYVLLADLDRHQVLRYDGVTGAFIDTVVPPGLGGLDVPWLMTFTDTDPATLAYTCRQPLRQQPR